VTLPVAVSAEDDYGVTRVQLYRSLNGSRALPMTFDVPSPPAKRLELPIQLPLSAYGLQPGDVIKLFARVEDNDPAGAKGSESSVVVIQIISDEQLQQLVRAREGLDVLIAKYQEAQRRLEAAAEEVEQLKKRLEKRDADGALSDEEREELDKLSERLSEEAKAVRESAKHVMPYDLDKALNNELEKLAERLEEASEAAAKESESKPTAGQAVRQLAKMQEQLEQEKKEMQEGINDPLEELADIYPLLEDQSRFVELYYRQRDLADRLNSLKNEEKPDDPAIKTRMRELESEQRKNREDLEELLNDIETHAKRLPDDDERLQMLAQSALEFVEAVRSSTAPEAMSNAELALGEFSGETARDEAKDAADILERFIARSQAMGEGGENACKGLKFQPGEGALGDTLSQLLGDAGFKQGMGMGAGGGYSARRNSMSKMGLYGNMPTRGNPKPASGGGKRQSGSVGGSYMTDSTNVSTGRLDPHGLLRSSGTSETAIPARYRGRVQEYFQRIAEEAGGQK
jgi:ABC-type transporter Mla subunit MlaD